MSHLSVRPRRLLGPAIQFLSLSVCIGSSPFAAFAELQGGTKTDSLSTGASQTLLDGGTKVNSLSGGANQTLLNGAAKVDSLSAGASQTLLNGAAKRDSLSAGASQTLLNGAAKRDGLSAGASQTLLNGAAKVDGLSAGARQTPLNGSTKSDSLSTGIHHTTLQGGIKDDAALRSSLQLLKPATDRGKPLTPGLVNSFLPGGVTQVSGNRVAGPLAPIFQTGTPINSVFNRPLNGAIAPISTYTLTRSNSRTWVAPGYEVTPATLSRSAAFVPPTSSSSSSSVQRGVTSWVPGYDVTSISQTVGAASAITARVGPGVAAYAPQYEVHKIVVTSQTLPYDPTSVTQKGVTSWAPGYEVSVTSHNKGVVVWTPGYELSRLVPGAIKETLSGLWHSGPSTPPLMASQGVLPQPQFAKVLVGRSPMVATGLLLPQLRAQALEKITWDEWYKRVARAIYCRWQYAEVGPGIATVRMVVTKDRDISCQLIDFQPATDIKRDTVAETFFRESALKAVRMVTKFEIPELPAPLDSDKVVFDLDLKRVVDGPVGVDVASSRSGPNHP